MKTTFTGHAQSIQPQHNKHNINCNIITVAETAIFHILKHNIKNIIFNLCSPDSNGTLKYVVFVISEFRVFVGFFLFFVLLFLFVKQQSFTHSQNLLHRIFEIGDKAILKTNIYISL